MSKRAWRRSTIDIAVPNDKSWSRAHTVRAFVCEPFAIHVTLGSLRGDWTLTHLPTGWAIQTGMRSFDAAEACLDAVEGLANWGAITAVTARHRARGISKAQGKAILAALAPWRTPAGAK